MQPDRQSPSDIGEQDRRVARNARSEIRGPGGALKLRPDDRAAQDLALLLEGETSGRPLEEILAEYSCSRSSYYDRLRRFHEHGLAGLLRSPPGPRAPWRRTLEVVRAIVTARLEDPERSAAAIAQTLQARGARVSERSVERTLSQFGLTRSRNGRAP